MARDTGDATDSVVIVLEPNEKFEFSELTDSFAGLATYYENNFGDDQTNKLYVTELKTKCIELELIPYTVILGALVTTAGNTITVADFVKRLTDALSAFAGKTPNPAQVSAGVTIDDAAAIAQFLKPLVGRSASSLRISHAKFERHDGDRSTVISYDYNQSEIDRASRAISHQVQEGPTALLERPDGRPAVRSEKRTDVILIIEAANRRAGKAAGRTVDKGIISSITGKALPLWFPESLGYLKHQIVSGEVNPFQTAFVVDAIVQFVDDRPKVYVITEIHRSIPIDDGEAE
ncbi:hypothetical protein [Hyphomicrobium sp.]|uniref:hypothetical protein n=1 Tax=Hyphomicrobium sp. TaxID=82 RepID=UPI000FA9ED6F|nr:hypothetical protein [Hyphomicrobium sp.]RUP07922.1 MAG: hypothetical protein EKK38_17395 [Hyphomicrobium sp.]